MCFIILWTKSRELRPEWELSDQEQINLMDVNLKNSVFRGWNETLSDVYSCLFRALSKYEKWSEFELRQYSDLSRLIEEW